jgi:HAE1 family hydrophobic/amphiphilic exporter-1
MTGEKLTRVRVRALRDPQHGLEPLQPTAIRTSHMEMVPFSEFCLPSIAPAEGELRRLNRKPVIPISMMLDKRSDPLSIAAGIQTAMSKIEMPPQYGYHFGDEIKEIRRTRNEMFMAVAAGLIFIYLILIVATESLLQPLLIMIALPFSVCGAIIALTLLKIPVSLPVYVGIMILCGLAVNVNVVMVYTISGFRREGTSLDEAVSRGSRRRLRPILMTVLTTSLAALPMLLDRGEGSSLWSPFALTLASGIVTGTLFSLVLTPLLYKHMERLKERIGRIKAYYTNAHSKK